MDKKTNLWELHYGPVFVTPMYFLENCDESYKTFSQDGHLLLTFTADVKLEALEEDRFFVCCLENVDLCDQVTENWSEIKMIIKDSKVPYGQGWEGVSIHSQPGNDTIDLDISSACVDKPM